MIRDNRGFTLVELLIAMGIAALISFFAYRIFIFSNKALKNWRERIRLENTAHLLLNAVANDLMELQQSLYAGKSAIGFINTNEDTIYYSHQEAYLLKNNRDKEKLSGSEVIIFLKKRYGDSLFYNLEGAAYGIRSNKFLIDLEKEGKIKLARKGYDLKYLLKRINNSDSIGFSKLYEEITGNSRKSIYDIDSAKSFFSKY